MSNFKTHNNGVVNILGTHLVGIIETTYESIVSVFGEPSTFEGGKSDVEWQIIFDSKVVAVIYNWKNGKNYCGNKGIRAIDVTQWHVGGISSEAVIHIMAVFADARERISWIEKF